MVYGKVINDETGEALIGATIYSVSPHGDQVGVSTTDYDGFFQTDQIPNNNKVGISYIGYITQEFNHRDGIYALTENTEFLNDVTIVGRKDSSKESNKTNYFLYLAIALVLVVLLYKIYKSNS